MKDFVEDIAELAGADDAAAWRLVIEDIAEERGYYDTLGPDHVALYGEAGATMLVTFETEDDARAREGRSPLGWSLARPRGWSSLVLMARGRTWFRDAEVFSYFDRLADDAFFDEFDRVIFLGAGPTAHAAAAFSVTAPGATVLALAPQATLTPALAGWDQRFPEARRRDFTSRYGYAPELCEAAQAAFVIADPAVAEDAMHAALFAASGATVIRARRFGADLAAILEQSGALAASLEAAADGRLDTATLYRALRARRQHAGWLRNLLADAEARGSPALVQRLCTQVVARGKRAPRFRRALQEANRALAERDAAGSSGPGA